MQSTRFSTFINMKKSILILLLSLYSAVAHADLDWGGGGGGYLPSYLGRTEVACDVRGEANCANKKRPSEYMKSQILADSMVFTDEGLRHLVAEMGASQVVYGTDLPFSWPDTLDLILNASYLCNAEKEAILGGNLLKLLRIG